MRRREVIILVGGGDDVAARDEARSKQGMSVIEVSQL